MQLCVVNCTICLHQHVYPQVPKEANHDDKHLCSPCSFNERGKPLRHTVCTHLRTRFFLSPTQSALIIIDSFSGRLAAPHYWLPFNKGNSKHRLIPRRERSCFCPSEKQGIKISPHLSLDTINCRVQARHEATNPSHIYSKPQIFFISGAELAATDQLTLPQTPFEFKEQNLSDICLLTAPASKDKVRLI